jgi:DNA-binding NarL/FixJ family response regulator
MAEFSRTTPSLPTSTTPLAEPLSTRELEILRLVSNGLSNKEIADTLVIAEGTVKNHLTSILGKLEARDRMQAVIKARELRII